MAELPGPTASRRAIATDAGALAVGTVAGGLAAYAFVVLGTRELGAAAYAPVSVLWTLWSIAAAVITFPVQHWLIRSLQLPGGEGVMSDVGPRLVAAAVGVGVVATVAAWAAGETLFGSRGLLFPLLTGVVPLGSLAVGVARGVLAGRHRFVRVSVVIAGENVLRAVLAGGLVLAGAGTPGRYGIVLVLGFVAAGAWPSALRPDRRAARTTTSDAGGLRLLVDIIGGSTLAQVTLTGAPVVVALLGGADAAVTSVFAGLALFRAPYVVATGLATRATAMVTTMHEQRDEARLARLRRGIAAAVLLAVVPVALLGATVGPAALRLVFGEDVVLEPTALAIIAGGTVVALGGLAMTVVLIARGRGAAVTRAWGLALTAGGTAIVVAPAVVPAAAPATLRALAGFGVAEVMALVLLIASDARWVNRTTAGHGRAGRSDDGRGVRSSARDVRGGPRRGGGRPAAKR